MAIAGLAVVVGIGLLVFLALAAARPRRHTPPVGAGGNAGGEVAWMSGIGGDGGASDGGCSTDGGGAGDGGGCDGGGGGGGD